jgi:hypothetical protein
MKLTDNWIKLSERRPDHGYVVWFDDKGTVWWGDHLGRGGAPPRHTHGSPTHWTPLSDDQNYYEK